MANDLTYDQAIEKLRKLSEPEQRLVLGKMSPDALKQIRQRLEAPQADFTANPKGEGLYRMLPSSDQGFTNISDEVQIPFSNVQKAIDAGFHLHPDEAPRYQRDFEHQGEGPTILERANDKIQNLLQPSTGRIGQMPIAPSGFDVNAMKAAGRSLYSAPEFLKDLSVALYGAVRPSAGAQDVNNLLNMIDPTQVPDQLRTQFREDAKKDPKLAVDNLLGSIAGMGILAAVTHGAAKTVGEVYAKTSIVPAEHLRTGIRDTLGVSENTERTVEKFGKESEDVRKKNVNETEQNRKDKIKAIKDRQEEEAKHQQATDEVRKRNDAVMRDRQKRVDTQQKLDTASKELDDKIAKAEKDANAANNAAWKVWRAKVANVQVDMQTVVDAIKAQTDKMSPEQVSTFKEILRETAPAEEDLSELDQTRNSIAKNAGYDKPYAELPPDRKAVIDDQIKRIGLGDLADEATGGEGGGATGGGRGLKQISASRLHGWKTQLEDAVRADRTGNVKYAIGQVLQVVRKLEEDVSKEAGADDELKKARALHGPYVDTFRNTQTTPGTAANYVRSKVTPGFTRDAKLEDYLGRVGQYDHSIPKLAQHVENLQAGLKALPKDQPLREQITLPPPPLEPASKFEPKPLTPHPEVPNIQAENVQYIDRGLRKYGKVGSWVLRIVVGGLTTRLAHGNLSEFGGELLVGQVGVTLLTKALRSPSVLEWLARPSAEDMQMIESLPPQDADKLRLSLNLLANEDKLRDPRLNSLQIAPAMAAWLAGGKATQQTPPALLDVKKQGEQLQAPSGPEKPINPYPNPEDQPGDVSFAFNKAWAKPGPYLTHLSPDDEAKFINWMKDNPGVVDQNEVNDPKAGYDVRGWWLAGEHGDPQAKRVRNAWDGKMHSSDKWKTPYNGTFSNESMYATPDAPRWHGDQLVTKDGRLVTDETPRSKQSAEPAAPASPPGPQAAVALDNLSRVIKSAQSLQGGGGEKPVWSHVYSEELGRIIPV